MMIRPLAALPAEWRRRGLFALLPFLLLVFSNRSAAGDPAILRVYSWSDYFADEVLASFEDKYNCVVAIDNFDSNEAMLEDLEDREGDVYDIITPSSYMTILMQNRGLLSPLNHRLVPNLKNIDPAFIQLTEDPGLEFSVPYTRTVTGVGFNAARLGDIDRSWTLLARPELAGRVTMLDDMRETIGAALKTLGHSLNTTDAAQLRQAGDLLLRWRGNLAMFEVDEGSLGLASGQYHAVHGYNGDVALLMEENGEIDFFVPREGSAITSDDFVIPADSRNRELAHAFINHFLDVENAAANMNAILYFMPVPDAVDILPAEVRDNHAFAVPKEVLDKCEVIRDLGPATELYERIWTEVKNGF